VRSEATKQSNYNNILEYVNSFIDFEKIPEYSYASSFRLERMHAFLKELGNPHNALKVIHIAGSKGKGSTCAIIASILKEAGYAVGLYTSPHLLDTRERIRVLNNASGVACQVSGDFEGCIQKQEFIGLIERMKPVAEKFRDHKELGKLSFFEILTACAFLYFKEKEVDFAVLETGLGGRLDATNVTEPVVCGITNISLAHTDKLGNFLEEIAREKAGIIKSQATVFCAPQDERVIRVIKDVCRERNAKLYKSKRDIGDLEINLLGAHQRENAALAAAISKHLNIKEEIIRRGLKNVSWPGRLQVIQKDPYLVLDGAQNTASIKAALSAIKQVFSYKRLICIFGVSSDKDIRGMSAELDKACDIIILTKSSSERAKDPIDLEENFSNSDIRLTDNVEKALGMGMEIANKQDLVLVTGSLYVVASALKLTFNNVKSLGCLSTL